MKETGDHGSFNSWGRDRYWRPNISEVNAWVRQVPDLPKLDAVKPNVLASNRWRCDHGWDIDLDDGSSFYIITNNLCLHGGIKNREGFGRVVENNVMVDDGLIRTSGLPGAVTFSGAISCGRTIVRRTCTLRPGERKWISTWCSITARRRTRPRRGWSNRAGAMNIPSWRTRILLIRRSGDYRVKDGSPALALGFVNFPMDQFGVQKPELKTIARVPQLPQPKMPVPPIRRPRRRAGDVAWRQCAQHCRRRRDVRLRSAWCDGCIGAGRSGGVGPGQSRPAEETMSFFPSTAGRRRTRRRCCDRFRALSAGSSLKIGVSRDQKEMVFQLNP